MTQAKFHTSLTMTDLGLSPAKASKYKNKKVVIDGHPFASQAEANRYAELLLLQRAGEIRSLELQPRYELVPATKLRGAIRTTAAIDYVADFAYEEKTMDGIGTHENGWACARWNSVIEDCKGAKTRVYLMKRHMMKAMFDLDIRETKPRR